MDEPDRKRFSELLLSLTSALPDYDQEISVFDYYVDESGEWDPWQSRLVQFKYRNVARKVFEKGLVLFVFIFCSDNNLS